MTVQEKEVLIKYVSKIIKDVTNWYDDEFGAEGNSLYIDGQTEYESPEDKEIIIKIINEIMNQDIL